MPSWRAVARHWRFHLALAATWGSVGVLGPVGVLSNYQNQTVGYQLGRAVDEFLLDQQRLFAIVDVWDALRSDWPYRESWPREKVLDHIQLLSGSHFDPAVTKAFLQMLESDPEV